jgi:hypothetical protein
VIVHDHFDVIKLFNDKLSNLRQWLYHRADDRAIGRLAMQLPCVPSNRWRLVIGVALIALTVGGIGWFPGRVFWTDRMRQQSAAHHQRAEAYARLTLTAFSGSPEEWTIHWDRDRWAWEMARKYWRAARFPWLSVEPDKPPPTQAVRSGLDVVPIPPPPNWPSQEPGFTELFMRLIPGARG